MLSKTNEQTALSELALEVLTGLSERPKSLSSRWFYDDRGSELFEAIMASQDYYPTDVERWIFENRGAELAARFAGQELDVVDLGAGDGSKTAILLAALREVGATVRYVPVDISEGAMQSLHRKMHAKLPDLEIAGVVGDYVASLGWLATQDQRSRLVLFLGSNIGNFDKPRARAFLRRIWSTLKQGDHLLVGFDLKKDIEVLLSAYNDSDGVTAQFNLNLLERINRELGGTFDLSKWRHYGTYNVFNGAMESYLVSLEPQEVWIESLRQSFAFQAWEPIHTEYSYKYLRSDIEALARFTNFEIQVDVLDPRAWFCDSLWKAV